MTISTLFKFEDCCSKPIRYLEQQIVISTIHMTSTSSFLLIIIIINLESRPISLLELTDIMIQILLL
jgi:hypothetical protein